MSSYTDKTFYELVNDLSEWPQDEFVTYLRSEALGSVSKISSASEIVRQILDEKQFENDDVRKMLEIIQKSSQFLKNLLDAAATIEVSRRSSK
jgi:pyrroloquinoline quinone (PQQ) biosynthesis protein C